MTHLEEIFTTLHDLDLCQTQTAFSVHWLGRSSGYFAYLKTTGCPPDKRVVGLSPYWRKLSNT